MSRHATAVASPGLAVLLALSCATPPPPALDSHALPSTTTSAEPLYITTDEVPATSAGPASSSSPASRFEVVPAALPPSVSVALDRVASCERKHCWRSWIVPRPTELSHAATSTYPDLAKQSPVGVWQEKMPGGVRLDFPRAKGVGLLGVVLSGPVTLSPSEGGTLAALNPWGAFVAPGAGVSLHAEAQGGDVVMIAYSLEGDLADNLAAVRKSEKAVYWEARPGRVFVDDLARTEDLSWAGGAAHARLGFEKDRSPNVYLGLLHMGRDVPVADHAHAVEWEVLIPLVANGHLTLSGQGADASGGTFPRDVPVGAGKVVTLPPAVHHAFKPAGKESLFAIQLFTPPGPEQRFRAQATQPASGASR